MFYSIFFCILLSIVCIFGEFPRIQKRVMFFIATKISKNYSNIFLTYNFHVIIH